MTTALPSLVADPSLRDNPSPPPSTHPTNSLPTHDPEYSGANTNTNTNPRTSYSSHLSATTRIIRIPRDWMIAGDLAPQYSNTYPEILEPWVSEQDFRTLLARVNEGLLEAFRVDGWRAWADMIAGVATGWLWEDLAGEKVRVKKGVRGTEAWIEEWNHGGGRESDGVRCIPDPKVRVVESEEPEPEPEHQLETATPTATETAPSTIMGLET
ncbi:MAG: hypothetical protein Q9216_005522 [Gyalolechia sp. 2 TL-2023]